MACMVCLAAAKRLDREAATPAMNSLKARVNASLAKHAVELRQHAETHSSLLYRFPGEVEAEETCELDI